MQELLTVIAQGLVDDPSAVKVAELPKLSAQLLAAQLSVTKKRLWLKSTDN